jgi:hypothetical protein
MKPGVRSGSARLAVALAALALLASGCGLGGREDVALRRFPYPYRAALAVVESSPSSVALFDGRIEVRPGPTVRTIGQNGPCSLVDRGKQLVECLRHYFRQGTWPSATYFGNRLLAEGSGRYLCSVYAPVLRGVPGVGVSTLDDALSERALLELEAKGCYMALSTSHLGDDADRQAAETRVASSGRASRVLVTSFGELARRRVIESGLVWSFRTSSDSVHIHVEAIDDPVGGRFVPSLEDLAGVTFYSPAPGSTAVLVAGRRVTELVVNPPDHTYRRSVTLRAPGAAGRRIIREGTSP